MISHYPIKNALNTNQLYSEDNPFMVFDIQPTVQRTVEIATVPDTFSGSGIISFKILNAFDVHDLKFTVKYDNYVVTDKVELTLNSGAESNPFFVFTNGNILTLSSSVDFSQKIQPDMTYKIDRIKGNFTIIKD